MKLWLIYGKVGVRALVISGEVGIGVLADVWPNDCASASEARYFKHC